MLTPLKAKLMSAIFSAMSSLHPADPNIDPQEAYCLAKNIYHEARSEGTAEQVMVATVTINMAKHRHLLHSALVLTKLVASCTESLILHTQTHTSKRQIAFLAEYHKTTRLPS